MVLLGWGTPVLVLLQQGRPEGFVSRDVIGNPVVMSRAAGAR